MRRQINADELAALYMRIGAALWHIQFLEDVLVSFLAMKIIHEQRCSGRTVGREEGDALLAEKRRVTFGPLIESCSSRKVIRPDLRQRFETFKVERHWLVHRSMVENGDDLYLDSAREALLHRVAAIQDEAIVLKKLVASDLDVWIASHGVDVDAAQRQAEETVRKLKGS